MKFISQLVVESVWMVLEILGVPVRENVKSSVMEKVKWRQFKDATPIQSRVCWPTFKLPLSPKPSIKSSTDFYEERKFLFGNEKRLTESKKGPKGYYAGRAKFS